LLWLALSAICLVAVIPFSPRGAPTPWTMYLALALATEVTAAALIAVIVRPGVWTWRLAALAVGLTILFLLGAFPNASNSSFLLLLLFWKGVVPALLVGCVGRLLAGWFRRVRWMVTLGALHGYLLGGPAFAYVTRRLAGRSEPLLEVLAEYLFRPPDGPAVLGASAGIALGAMVAVALRLSRNEQEGTALAARPGAVKGTRP
jgi:hypothetical protein